MHVTDLIDYSFACRLISTFAHFLWQGSLVALFTGLGDRLLSGTKANLRYTLHVTSMTIMVALVIITFTRITPPNSPPPSSHNIAVKMDQHEHSVVRQDQFAARSPTTSATSSLASNQSLPTDTLQATTATDHLAANSASRPSGTAMFSWQSWSMLAPWLALAYLAGVGSLLIRLVLGVWQAQRLRQRATLVADTAILQVFQQQCRRVGLRVQPVLAWSAEVSIPIVTGVLRPLILLPSVAMTSLSLEQLQSLLAHELAHIRRFDLWVNVLQRLFEAVLFFHPAVWWVSRRISQEREFACDELVLAAGCERLRYADALVRMAELSTQVRTALTAASGSLAATGSSSSELKRRVLRILEISPQSDLPNSRLAILVGLTSIVLVVALAHSRPSFQPLAAAQRPDSKSSPQSAPPLANAQEAGVKQEPSAKQDAGAKPNETNQDSSPLPIVEIVEGFTSENLPIPDVSHIRDPISLLDQLQKGPRVSHFSMTSGSFATQPNGPPSAWQVERWTEQFADDARLDPRVRQLISLGESARIRTQERLPSAAPQVQSHLALVLRSTGNANSIPVLIQSLRRLNDSELTARPPSAAISALALTSALWELTGRKHQFSAAEWERWWNEVKTDFVVARERQRPEFMASVTKERVAALARELANDEKTNRERLIALGKAATPYLLELLRDEMQRAPVSEFTTPGATRTPSMRLAWVIDELGGTQELPALVRLAYFTQRFSASSFSANTQPVDEDALSRALSHCSFAEYCSIYLAADTNTPARGGQTASDKWPFEINAAYCRRFSPIVPPNLGGWSDNPHWKKVIPAETPASEIAGAVPVLVNALKDQRAAWRNSAAKLADAIGFCSRAKPEPLIVALRDAWLAESDGTIRPTLAFAMCRFATPIVVREIVQGIHSDRPEIVSDCAGLIDWIPVQLTEETRPAFERLVELTRHDNDELRRRAVRSLRSKAPKLLEPELARLRNDRAAEIRKECAYALRVKPSPQFADLLFQLADDADEQVRIEAILSIGNLSDTTSMERLKPLLRDKRVQGYAVAALVSIGGKDALPLMMSELENGNAMGGMVYQHLRKLSDQSYEDKPEPWLDWWSRRKVQDRGNGAWKVDVPNGVRLELVGISTIHAQLREKDERRWWDGRGTIIGSTEQLLDESRRILARPEYASGREVILRLTEHGQTAFVDALRTRSAWIEVEAGGVRANPPVFIPTQTPPLMFQLSPHGLREASESIDLQLHTHFVPKPSEKVATLRVGFGHEVTSRTYDLEGKLAHEKLAAEFPAIWRQWGLLRIEQQADGLEVWTMPTRELGDLGFAHVQVLMVDGQVLNSIAPQVSEDSHEERHLFSKVNREDVEGVKISVQTVTHWVRFSGLPLQPGTDAQTPVDVEVVAPRPAK
jgi:beta-lactamase regulating signal transducer with metallopeptidase domain/HEAT repeat protein